MNNNHSSKSAKPKVVLQRVCSKKDTIARLNEIEKNLQTLLDADFDVDYKKIIISIVMDLKEHILKSTETTK
ncbi:hypothetical protein KKF63_01035 [bacterium]|nr:hypothetical protein [bacterium]